jgi:hypothetical protein
MYCLCSLLSSGVEELGGGDDDDEADDEESYDEGDARTSFCVKWVTGSSEFDD